MIRRNGSGLSKKAGRPWLQYSTGSEASPSTYKTMTCNYCITFSKVKGSSLATMGFAYHWRAKLWNHCPVFFGSYLIGNRIKFHYFHIWRGEKTPSKLSFWERHFHSKKPSDCRILHLDFQNLALNNSHSLTPQLKIQTESGFTGRESYSCSTSVPVVILLNNMNIM